MTTEYDTDSLLEADGTTKMARNGEEATAANGGTSANGGIFNVLDVNVIRETNARREGVTRDMSEECSVLCNR